MVRGKKGVSIVVASVLLIMLTVVAAALIASFVIPFVRNNLYGSTACLNYKSYFTFQQTYTYNGIDEHYNCFRGNLYSVAVTSESLEGNQSNSVKGFNLVLSDGNNSVGIKIINGSATSTDEGKARMLNENTKNFTIPKQGGLETYIYQGDGKYNFNSVSIQPVLSSGQICGETDTIKLEQCDPSLSLDIK